MAGDGRGEGKFQLSSDWGWEIGYDLRGKFFFSISGSALVVSLGIKLTGFQGFFFRITFWVGQVQKTEIFKNFDRGLRKAFK